MKYITAFYTDAGTRKKENQDSYLCVQASYGEEPILFAAVCDGCGGLDMGEAASGSLVKRLSDWFAGEMPKILARGFSADRLQKSLRRLVRKAHQDLQSYGISTGKDLGTTCAALLLTGGKYYILNVGDSRVYLISDGLYQLTKDHTVDGKQSVLTRCIGAGDDATPDFFSGPVRSGQTFLLCTDGFIHRLTPSEICRHLAPSGCTDRTVIRSALMDLTDLCKSRGEKDNITSLIVCDKPIRFPG